MATAAVVAGAVASVAAAGIGAASSAGAFGSGASGKVGSPKSVPLPPYAAAINRIVARDTAANMNRTPPSFATWLQSGGTADFGMKPTGMTPQEAQDLRLVDRSGNPIPQFELSQIGQPLTQEQKMYLGELRNRKSWTTRFMMGADPLSKYWRETTGKTGEPQWVIDKLSHQKGGGFMDTLGNILSGGMHQQIKDKLQPQKKYVPPTQKKKVM